MSSVLSWSQATAAREAARRDGRTVIFTNGCFDIIHRGHVDILAKAKALGDILVVGLNDDASVTRLKGAGRPLNPAGDRAAVLAALRAVDQVVIFEQDTPLELVQALEPDILVKGADYEGREVVGREVVEAAGGRVVLVPLTEGRSTSGVVQRLRDQDLKAP